MVGVPHMCMRSWLAFQVAPPLLMLLSHVFGFVYPIISPRRDLEDAAKNSHHVSENHLKYRLKICSWAGVEYVLLEKACPDRCPGTLSKKMSRLLGIEERESSRDL